MTEPLDPLDRVILDLAADHHPPDAPDRDALWTRIAAERVARGQQSPADVSRTLPCRRPPVRAAIAAAALFALGMGIGREWTLRTGSSPSLSLASASVDEPANASLGDPAQLSPVGASEDISPTLPLPSDPAGLRAAPLVPPPPPAVVARHLARSAILISTFRNAAASGGSAIDQQMFLTSTELLGATRRMEEAAADSSLRRLLGDLDLVLAQITQYTARAGESAVGNASELELIEDAIQRRGLIAELQARVLPRHKPNSSESN